MRRTLLAGAVVALALTGSTAATQERREREVALLRESCEPGSDEWLRWSFELIEAQLSVDVELARASADSVCTIASSSPTPGVEQAAYAYSALANTLIDGVTAASEPAALVGATPGDAAPPWVRAYFSVARARQRCVERSPLEEYIATVATDASAKASGDPILIARARMLVHHTASDVGLETAQSTFKSEREAIERTNESFLRSRLAYDEHILASLVGDTEGAASALDAAQSLAEAEGNRRVLAAVAWRRGVGAVRDGDPLGARDHFAQARELALELHDRILECQMLQYEADAALRVGAIEVAEELIQRSEERTRGRGLHELE